MIKQIRKVRIRLKNQYYSDQLKEFLRKYCSEVIMLVDDDGQEAAWDEYTITDEVPDNRERTLVLGFGDDRDGFFSVFQPVDEIVNALLEMAEQEEAGRRFGGDRLQGRQGGQDDDASDPEGIADRFVCVYSPQGGSGKTTFAMTIADVIAGRYPDKRILYWMMEDFPEWDEYFESNSRFTMSDGIYWSLMDEQDEFRTNLDLVAVRQRNNVYFIRPCRSNRDLAELSDVQIRRFAELLAECFDLVICDMGSAWEGVNSRILPLCGRVYLLYRDIAAGSRRLEAFLRAEENRIPGRITLVQTGGSGPALIRDAVILPRSPGVLIWEGSQRVPDRSSDYYEHVRNLV